VLAIAAQTCVLTLGMWDTSHFSLDNARPPTIADADPGGAQSFSEAHADMDEHDLAHNACLRWSGIIRSYSRHS
jgi:hypothetical protein